MTHKNMLVGTSLLLVAGVAAGKQLTGKVHAIRLAGATAAACGIAFVLQAL